MPAERIKWRRHSLGMPQHGIVLHIIEDRDKYVLADVGDLSGAWVQIDCWASIYAQAEGIVRAGRTLLSGYQASIFYQMRLIGARRYRGRSLELGDPAGVSLDFVFRYCRT